MYKDNKIWMLKFQDRMNQAKRHVEFCAEVYKHQRGAGKYFLREHPWLATSWKLNCIARLERCEDVTKVMCHMCQFGMKSRTARKGSALGLALRPKGFMSNSSKARGQSWQD